METIHRQGGSRLLGISNCYQLELLQRLYNEAQIKPQIVQNRFYADSDYDIALRTWCMGKNIRYQSFWTLTANPQVLTAEPVLALASKYDKAPAQILFNYLRQRQVTPLTGTSSQDHMTMDLASFDVEFNYEELRAIDQLGLGEIPVH